MTPVWLFLGWVGLSMIIALMILTVTAVLINHSQNKLRKQLERDIYDVWKAPIE